MKKNLTFLFLLLATIGFSMTFTACSDDDKKSTPAPVVPVTITDIKCIDDNSLYCYDGVQGQPEVEVREGTGVSILEVQVTPEATGENEIAGDPVTFQFRDLNKNNELDDYEDWRLSLETRVADLLSNMSGDIEAKAGLLTVYMASFAIGDDGWAGIPVGWGPDAEVGPMNNTRMGMGGPSGDVETRINLVNAVQRTCERTTYGIPYAFCCDPCTGTGNNAAATNFAKQNGGDIVGNWAFTQAFGAINDPEYAKEIGSLHAQAYRAGGIRIIYGPQCDPLSEPRWARAYDTMGGPTCEAAGENTKAYMQGLQGVDDGFYGHPIPGVACTLKHYPGAGTNVGGMDSHTYHGRFAPMKGNNLEEHLRAFEIACEAGPLALMPCYSLYLTDYNTATNTFAQTTLDYIAASYEEHLMQEILRDDWGWDGMVTSDWGVGNSGSRDYGLRLADMGYPDSVYIDNYDEASETFTFSFQTNPASPTDIPETAPQFEDWTPSVISGRYGDVYGAIEQQHYIVMRYAKAGGHQLGQAQPTIWVNAYNAGFLTEADIDEVAGKVLETYMRMGLFENPYTDLEESQAFLASEEFTSKQKEMRKRACVLLKNEGDILPLQEDSAQYVVYYDGITDDAAIEDYLPTANVTEDITAADVIVLRVSGRFGTYGGLTGGVPLSYETPLLNYYEEEWRHRTWDEHVALINSTAGPGGTDNGGGTTEVDGVDYSSGGYIGRDGNYSAALSQMEAINNAIAVKQAAASEGRNVKIVLVAFTPRPMVVEPWIDQIDAFMIEFGIYDDQLMEVLFAVDGFAPTSHLPWNFPSSDEAVEAQYEDVMNDDVDPTYAAGFGLTW